MLKQWEEFEFGPVDKGRELHVTLSRKGEITIGAVAMDRLGEPEAAVLMFDKVNSLIGVNPSAARVSNAYRLIQRGKYRHRIIRASRFCTHHGIKVDRTVAFRGVEVDEDGVLVLDLKQLNRIGSVRRG